MLRYGIAAAFTIATTVFIWVITNKPRNVQELYAEYYTPYEGGPLLRGEEQDSMQMALSAYYQEDYPKALSLFLNLKSPKRLLRITPKPSNSTMNTTLPIKEEEISTLPTRSMPSQKTTTAGPFL